MAEVKPKRIALWCIPRSLSTAMVMSFGNYGNVEVFNELYGGCAGFGPEGTSAISSADLGFPIQEDLTYGNAKSQLEAAYPTRDLVFLKDHAMATPGKYDKLPVGFTHSFLIRNPQKTLPSGVKLGLVTNIAPEQTLEFFRSACRNKGFGLGDMVDLAEHVENTLKQPLVILDADDLQRDPEKMLRAFCKAVDLPFRDSLLKWDPIENLQTCPWHTPKSLLTFHSFNGAYANALKSSGWVKSDPKPADLSSSPQCLLDAIEEAMPFYEALYAKRLKPDC